MNDENSPFRKLATELQEKSRLTKQMAAMLSPRHLSPGFAAVFRIPQAPFSDLIHSLTRTAQFAQTLNSVGTEFQRYIDSTKQLSQLGRESIDAWNLVQTQQDAVWRSLREPFRIAKFHQEALLRITEGLQEGSLGKLYELYPSGRLSKAVESVLDSRRILELPRITELANRVSREGEFQNALLRWLESQAPASTQASERARATEEIFETIEQGIRESGLAQPSKDPRSSLRAFQAWWLNLHPSVQGLLCNLIAVIVSLAIEYGFLVRRQPESPATTRQEVRIVQRIVQKYRVTNISLDVHPRLAVVCKDQLPVFRSHRRDSSRLGVLSGAQLVIIKSQKRKWTQIEWRDQMSQEVHTGWVFARYLKRI
jgi:hypothetical protein